jgi:hypothetical protein
MDPLKRGISNPCFEEANIPKEQINRTKGRVYITS